MANTHKWQLEPNVAEVASRRIARRRGVKGFANARDVRTLFQESYTRATNRIDREYRAEKRGRKAVTIAAPPLVPPAPAPAAVAPMDAVPEEPAEASFSVGDRVMVLPSAVSTGELPWGRANTEATITNVDDPQTLHIDFPSDHRSGGQNRSSPSRREARLSSCCCPSRLGTLAEPRSRPLSFVS